jgi:hypothetical protein
MHTDRREAIGYDAEAIYGGRWAALPRPIEDCVAIAITITAL